MRIAIFEDNGHAALAPLSLTRPVFSLRSGAASLLDRQRRFFAADEAGALVQPERADLCRLNEPDLVCNDPAWLTREPLVLVNGRWLPPLEQALLSGPRVGLVGDQVAYVVLPAGQGAELTASNLSWRLAEWAEKLPCHAAGGVLIQYVWNLIEHNGATLEQDYQLWQARGVPQPGGLPVVGPAERFRAAPTARIEPMVLIDTTRGPVLVDDRAVVQAFSRLEGPCYVGPDTQVLGARVRGSSVGPQCRIGGEVEATVIHGHSNKAHDGFVGHSYLGEWVNLGAGTQVSDLRTDYARIRMRVGGVSVDTGLIKLGVVMGDHTKTSINTLINTGTTVGVFAQLLTSGALMPRGVPSFCQVGQGGLQERSDLREMFAGAATAMGRRDREWTPAHAELFFTLFEQTADERHQLIRESEQRRLRRVI
jgi:UDP-N-acetylglucosamine diphosphorylase/glucosamine-1-phosphate N-acetyltransferase